MRPNRVETRHPPSSDPTNQRLSQPCAKRQPRNRRSARGPDPGAPCGRERSAAGRHRPAREPLGLREARPGRRARGSRGVRAAPPRPKPTPGLRRGPPGLAELHAEPLLPRPLAEQSGGGGLRARLCARTSRRVKEAGRAARPRVYGARARWPARTALGPQGRAAEPCALVRAGEPHGRILNVWRVNYTSPKRWKGPSHQPSPPALPTHPSTRRPWPRLQEVRPGGSRRPPPTRPHLRPLPSRALPTTTATSQEARPRPTAGPFSSARSGLRRPLCGRQVERPAAFRMKTTFLTQPPSPPALLSGPSSEALFSTCALTPSARRRQISALVLPLPHLAASYARAQPRNR